MKHTAIRYSSVRQPMYPNAADERYFTEKALEILTAIVTGTGAITLMLLLVTIS